MNIGLNLTRLSVRFSKISSSDGLQCLLQVGKQVVDVFRADGKPDRSREDFLNCLLLWCQLSMGGTGRMDDERLRVGYVGQQGKDLKTVNEPVCFFLSPVDEDGKDGSSAMRKVVLVTSVVRMAGQGRMVDPFHLGMSVKKGCNAQGIGYMALYPKRKCFQSLKQQESIERADGGTCVTQQDGTDAGDIGCMAGRFGEAQAW